MGLCGTVQLWIPNYSQIASSITTTWRKGKDFEWTSNCQDAFDELKALIISASALTSIDYTCDWPIILSVDSSYLGVVIILSHIDEHGKKRPTCYESLPFSTNEANYSQPKLELYGLFWALAYFHHTTLSHTWQGNTSQVDDPGSWRPWAWWNQSHLGKYAAQILLAQHVFRHNTSCKVLSWMPNWKHLEGIFADYNIPTCNSLHQSAHWCYAHACCKKTSIYCCCQRWSHQVSTSSTLEMGHSTGNHQLCTWRSDLLPWMHRANSFWQWTRVPGSIS